MFDNKLSALDLTPPDTYQDLQIWLRKNFELLSANTWNHVSTPIADLGKGATKLTISSLGDYDTYLFGVADEGAFVLALPHTIDSTQDALFDIGWYVDEDYVTSSAEIQWQLDYSVCTAENGDVLDAPTRTGTLVSGDVNIPTTAKTLTSTTFTIPASVIVNSHDVFGFVLTRVALDAGTNPAGNVGVANVHFAYQANRLGTIGTH